MKIEAWQTMVTAGATAGAAAPGVVEAAVSGNPTISLWVFLAAVSGALINVLYSIKNNGQLIDLAIAGVVSMFCGLVLGPLLIAPLEAFFPTIHDAGDIPATAVVALFGSHYLQKVMRSLQGGDA